MGSTLYGKNLLLEEQILSLKGRPYWVKEKRALKKVETDGIAFSGSISICLKAVYLKNLDSGLPVVKCNIMGSFTRIDTVHILSNVFIGGKGVCSVG